ncbi:dTMP kinase [Novosphingopyxis iocasae]|uniref:dTMP kinase n=1 Tax=Novosphingopyxis iocasae TaxID=2762729 RepID=UPI001650F74B|nr:dTMP kinase [Novosphingopyxis iocasae]
MERGRFIALEGGEGTGKSTQVKALAADLSRRGIDVVTTREPGGTVGAEAIRNLLLEGAADRWTPESEALLFAAARADHVAKLIRPAIEQGQWVLSDRYVDSSRAYQSASGLPDDDLMTLHRIGSDGLLPDRVLLLELPGGEAGRRAHRRDGGAGDRIGGRDEQFHADVAGAFRRYAAAEPDRFRRIEASGPPEEVTRALVSALGDYIS